MWEERGCMWASESGKKGWLGHRMPGSATVWVEEDRQEPGCLLTGGVCRARVGGRGEGKFYMNMWHMWDWACLRHPKQRDGLTWCLPERSP